MIPTELIKSSLKEFDLAIDESAYEKFDIYGELLTQWNEKINLTAIKEPSEIAVKHFLDCCTILKAADFKMGDKVIDVGTGAGFPGVPLKIIRPEIELTLLDSLQKRLTFLDDLLQHLSLSANLIHSRAEDGGQSKDLREKFDYATARAVANLRDLSEYCIPFVKIGGKFISMKGPDITDELDDAKNAIKALGGDIEDVISLSLPDGSGRTIVVIRKIAPTPQKYPRPSAKIKKNPIK